MLSEGEYLKRLNQVNEKFRANQGMINKILNDNIESIEEITMAKGIPQLIGRLFAIISTAMQIYYGSEIKEEFKSAIANLGFACTVPEFLSQIDPMIAAQIKPTLTEEKIKEGPAFISVTFPKSYDGKINIHRVLFVSKDATDFKLLLELLAHELNHLICSKKHNIYRRNGYTYIRCGLFTTNLNNGLEIGRAINEIVNTIVTDDLIDIIIRISQCDIEDPMCKNILGYLKFTDKEKKYGFESKGYDWFTPLKDTIKKYPNLKQFLIDRMYDGDIIKYEKISTEKYGSGVFEKITKDLDKLLIVSEQTNTPPFVIMAEETRICKELEKHSFI